TLLLINHQLDMNKNAGLDVLRGGDPDNGTLVPVATPTGPINTPLPAGQIIDSTLNVTQSFLVQAATIKFSILHQNIPDLT
ncbi:hypothetical protein, partial [Pseudomonas aeruginosa]|uniref:hypothetical protein n=1 Tax=Pseudomonas aeruginosa TaxID=287 RepID=UPI002F94634A